MFYINISLVVYSFLLSMIFGAPINSNGDVLIQIDDLNNKDMQRLRRDLTLEINAAEANEPVDKDYDMELAEVHLFRPVFSIRSSYLRRGG
ncbi:uncharacterized protein LOC142239194 isoform X2 [Haematobia irritans]